MTQPIPRKWLNRRAFGMGLGVSPIFLLKARPVMAERIRLEDFGDGDASGWRYVSDRVMGGVSDGEMQMLRQGETWFARLTGTVSTENNGGFIQFRRALETPLPGGSAGLRLKLRGNGARYYVHLRPASSRRPWQYFSAAFDTSGSWQEIDVPWTALTAQGGLVAKFAPEEITSIGIVAYGADYQAQLDVAWIDIL